MADMDEISRAAVEAAELAMEAGKTEDEISRAAVDAAWAVHERGVDGDAFCMRCGLPLVHCLCKPRRDI